MEIKRFEFGTDYIVGKLYVDGLYKCYTLERGEFPEPGSYPFLLDDSTFPYLITPQNEILLGMYWYGVDKLSRTGPPARDLQEYLQTRTQPHILQLS